MSTTTWAPVAAWNSGASFLRTAAYWSLSAARLSVTPSKRCAEVLAEAEGEGLTPAAQAVVMSARVASNPVTRELGFMRVPLRREALASPSGTGFGIQGRFATMAPDGGFHKVESEPPAGCKARHMTMLESQPASPLLRVVTCSS